MLQFLMYIVYQRQCCARLPLLADGCGVQKPRLQEL